MQKHVLVALILAVQLICSSDLLAQDSCKSKPSSFLSTYMTQLSRGAVQGLASTIECANLTPREKAEEYQRHLTLRYESMINDVNTLFTYFSVTHVGDVTIAEKKLIKEFYDLILGMIPGVSTVWSSYNFTSSLLSELVDGSSKPVNPIHRLEQLRDSFVTELEMQQRSFNQESFLKQLECNFTTAGTASACALTSVGKLSCQEISKIKDEKLIAQSKAKFQAAFARVVGNNIRLGDDTAHFEISLELLDDGARVRSDIKFVGYGADAILCKLAKDPAIVKYGNNDVPIEVIGMHADVVWHIGQFRYLQIINSNGKQEKELKPLPVYSRNYLEVEPFHDDVQEWATRRRASSSMINIWNLTEHCR